MSLREDITVLVAEDNEVNQKIIRTILDKNGYTYRIVENGVAALELYQNEKFKVILMDCQMPEMDGLTAATKIREIEKKMNWTRIPIVALTANAMKGDREKCLESGMDDFLSKPFRMAELLSLLNKWTIAQGREG